ncbi:Endogenous retrovirus group FC1 Env polyprotein [Plecturocebus cupreus]
MVVGLSLASSLVAAGLGSGALGYSVTSATQLEDNLRVAIKASAASLASLQRQITSLAQVTLQNRRALDLLTAEKGGTCLFLQEQCCYYINETGLVEENVDTLYRLQEDLRKKQNASVLPLNWWQSPMLTWLTPIITPIIVFTGPHKENFQSGRKPDATSPVCLTPNRGTSLTLPPHPAPIQQEVARKKRCPISSKGSECKAACLARRPDTPTSAPGSHLHTRHLAAAHGTYPRAHALLEGSG